MASAVGEKTAGTALKTKTGWDGKGAGTDAYGFSALPGGSRAPKGGFSNIGNRGLWWVGGVFDKDSAYYRRMGNNYNNIYEGNFGKGSGFSVRCVETGDGDTWNRCGGKEFDTEQYFCHKSKLVERCEICEDGEDGVVFNREIGIEYDPETQFCGDGDMGLGCDAKKIVYQKCGGKEYNTSEEFCHKKKIIKMCFDFNGPDGVIYNPDTQRCVVVDKETGRSEVVDK